jgi:2-methylcitrate dehydratase PrpD
VTAELGKRFEMTKLLFKKYPSCGGTLAGTDAMLALVKEKGLAPENVSRVDIRVVPYIYKIVGHPFKTGENPKVNAQFSIQYCVANALLRGSSKLKHFDEPQILDPRIPEILEKVHITAAPELDQRGHNTACEMTVTGTDGRVYHKRLDVAPGFPENPLTREEQDERFRDCIDYSGGVLPRENVEKIVSMVNSLEAIEHVSISMIPLLVRPEAQGGERDHHHLNSTGGLK